MPIEHLAAGKGLIFLTGAPSASVLTWDDEHLSAPLLEAFQDRSSHAQELSASPPDQPAWRLVPIRSKHLPSGFTQASRYSAQASTYEYQSDEQASFLTASDLSFLPSDSRQDDDQVSLPSDDNLEDLLTQFYDHSFTIHDEIPASQVLAVASPNRSGKNLRCKSAEREVDLQAPPIARPKPRSRHLSTLQDIPNAAHLRSLEPQTMTVDLVVGILDISQPQLIQTRKYSGWAELVDMIVADETKAGFSISIWLPQSKSSKATKGRANDNIRSKVTGLRPRDIVLAKNVALKSFRAKVHGQSMRSANTSLELLYRNVIDSHDEPGAYNLRELATENGGDPQLIRVRKLKDWITTFVGYGPWSDQQQQPDEGDWKFSNKALQQLPPDTQYTVPLC
ncbi:MAG: hypothetical protein Q9191_002622 [Dirinaria sp. TL-2023a]